MTLSIKRQIVRDPQGRIKLWVPRRDGPEYVHMGVWVDGSPEELASVQSVEYRLSAAFKRPSRRSEAAKNKFSVTFWTWGGFAIDVVLHRKDGSLEHIPFELAYELPDSETYVEVDRDVEPPSIVEKDAGGNGAIA